MGQKARQIEVVNEVERIYVLLIHTIAAHVDDIITRKLIYHAAVHHLSEASLVGVMMALLASHSRSWWWASRLGKTKSKRFDSLEVPGSIPLTAALCAAQCSQWWAESLLRPCQGSLLSMQHLGLHWSLRYSASAPRSPPVQSLKGGFNNLRSGSMWHHR